MITIPLSLIHADPMRNKSGRNVLLIEPNYRNKYPPLGLMKLSAYHKQLGDSVTFFKGSYSAYFFEEQVTKCLDKIRLQNCEITDWDGLETAIRSYLKYRHNAMRDGVLEMIPCGYKNRVQSYLIEYAHRYTPERKWDRIYITTLFTFYWKQTIDAIEFAKKIVKTIDSLYLGGVAASLIPELFAEEAGLMVGRNIITGLLDKPNMLDDNGIIIDEITPDYAILETLDYQYPLDTGYLTYMTKGCTRTCSFCAVPKLEPVYKDKISIQKQIDHISREHGERKDLILMDNNVLGSPRFAEIVNEILEMGFEKGATFVEPNRLDVLISYLQKGEDDALFLRKISMFLDEFGQTRIKKAETRTEYYRLLQEHGLDNHETIKKESVLAIKNALNEYIEKYRNKSKKKRYIDFNQGIDCRYVNEVNMALLAQLPIRPMRIAFDHIALRQPYENAVRLADKYGVRRLSNYILFNYKDKPAQLWERLKINLDLNSELEASVYSFPMKFIPLYGKESTHRQFIGKHWNRKYIRAIQCVLHVTRGVVTVNPPFFDRAFGRNVEEFFDILMMPEPYIMYRNHFEETGDTKRWLDQYKNLNSKESEYAKKIIYTNQFSYNGSTPKAVEAVLQHYLVKYKGE